MSASNVLYKEFVLRGPSVWDAFCALIKANAKACNESGHPLRLIVTTEEKKRSKEQNARLWAYTYKTIAEQAWINGHQYSAEVFHEYLGDKFLPRVEMSMPDGSIKSRRMSTTELSVAQMAEYMNQVEAFASMELGVQFQ